MTDLRGLNKRQRAFHARIERWNSIQDVLDRYPGRVQSLVRYNTDPKVLITLCDEAIVRWGSVGPKRLASIQQLIRELKELNEEKDDSSFFRAMRLQQAFGRGPDVWKLGDD